MAEENEKRSPAFDWDKGEFVLDLQNGVKTVTADEALTEIVIKAQQTTRGIYLIYASTDDADADHIYGSDATTVLAQNDLSNETRISELQRAIREAIAYDPWVTDVTNVNIATVDGKTYASYTISTIFDTDINIEGVNIDG